MKLPTLTAPLLIAMSSLLATPALATEVSFVTFNVERFGLEEDPGDPTFAERDAAVRQHMIDNNLFADVIAFQEIVAIDRLEENVLRGEYRCVSYEHENPRHIHVVVCHKPYLRFDLAPDDDDYALREIAFTDRLRPAVHGIVKTASGRALAHVVAVHMKSSPSHSDTRAEQAEIIATYLAGRRDTLPVVMLGDANTHGDDMDRLGGIFDSHGLDMIEIYTRDRYTWRVPEYGGKFDRIWVQGAHLRQRPVVAGPCNLDDEDRIGEYNWGVSDHCPVRFSLNL